MDANSAEIAYEYDQNSNIIAITDALGNTTRYEYDAAGNKTKETAPDGSSYSLQYDENNNLTRLTDQLGGVTLYEYDEHNRLVKQTNPDGGVTAYSYNDMGQVLTVTDPMGNVTAYEYDGVDLIKSTDPNGNETGYAYDAQHRLVSTTDALGNTTSFAYDERDNLTSVTFADGTSFAYEYDKVGDLISQTDALGNVTRFEYDALRQLVKTTYPDGSESTSGYDHSGNLVSAVDALGGEAAASYDGRGNLLTLTDAEGNVTNYEYDLNGNLLTERLADGTETRYTYDVCGRISSVTSGGERVAYRYDAAGNLLCVAAPEGTTTYTYDCMSRVTSLTEPDGSCSRYRYDLAGQLAEMTGMNGIVSSYEWDACGNLLLYTDTAGGYTAYYYDKLYRLQYVTAKDEFTGELVTVDWIEEEDDAVPSTESTPKSKPQARMASGSSLKVEGVRSHSLHLEKVAHPLEGGGSGKTSPSSSAGEAKYLAQRAQQDLTRTMSAVRQTQAAAPGSPAAQAAQRAYYEAQQTYTKVQNSSRAAQQGSSSALMQMQLESRKLQSLSRSTQVLSSGAVTNRRIQQASKQYSPAVSNSPSTAAAKPAVQSIWNQVGSCFQSFLNAYTTSLQQQYAAQMLLQQAEFSGMLGAINAASDKVIDAEIGYLQFEAWKQTTFTGNLLSALNGGNFRVPLPILYLGISALDSGKEKIAEQTREAASNKLAYDIGMLTTDIAVAISEYYGAAQLIEAISAAGLSKLASQIMSSLGSGMPQLALVEGPAGSIAGAIVIDTASANALIGALAAAGNLGDISDHVNQLKEDLKDSQSEDVSTEKSVKPVDTGDLTVVETRSAETANAEWAERGYTNPPYDPEYEVKIVEAGNEEYVRVYSYDEAGKANKSGQWIMKKDDILGLTPAEITDKYALPKEPTHMCDVELPSDYKLECGIANRVDGWGSGGGLQFDFMGQRVADSSFVNEVLIGG